MRSRWLLFPDQTGQKGRIGKMGRRPGRSWSRTPEAPPGPSKCWRGPWVRWTPKPGDYSMICMILPVFGSTSTVRLFTTVYR